MKKLIGIFIVLAFSLFPVMAQAIPVEIGDNCTLEEALDLPDVVWETGGFSNWFCQEENFVFGGSAVQTGEICADGRSWLQTTVTVDEMKLISFQWKIGQQDQQEPPPCQTLTIRECEECPPCPECPDCPPEPVLSFYVDDCLKGMMRIRPDHPLGGDSLNGDWDQVIACLSPGTHTLRWEYARGGEDCGDCPNSPDLSEPDCECYCPRCQECPECPDYDGWVDHVEIVDPPSVNLMKHYLGNYPQPCSVDPQFAKNRVAKAESDEIYEGDPKTNQAYVFSIARSDNGTDNIWFGTVANMPCLVMEQMGMALGGVSLPLVETANLVCELGESSTGTDWRDPQIFEYDPLTMSVLDRTPPDMAANPTYGIRSAGALDGVVLMSGPSRDYTSAINIFAFRASDGFYLGMQTLTEYNNIRHQWVVHDGVMYVGVNRTADGAGRILRWNGDEFAPFQFEDVGNIDLGVANMTVHRNRLFATTWPDLLVAEINLNVAGLWRSPVIPPGGLTNSDNESWEQVWSISDYEPDMIMQRASLGGAIASLDGTLFWGTMHVPFLGTAAALMSGIDFSGIDSEIGPDDITALALGTHRATSVYSSTFETSQSEVELLYGDEYLPVYDPSVRSYTIAEDDMHRNNMGNAGKWGPSGICSYFNAYTWTLERAFVDYPTRGGLALGTFDSSFMLRDMAGAMLSALMPDCADCGESALDVFLSVMDELYNQYGGGYGADLYVIRSAEEAFILDSKDGAGNYLNYGIRTMLMPDGAEAPGDVAEPDFMGEETCPQGYLGMANPFNLAEEGGWELIQIHPMPEIVVVSPTPDQFVIGDLMLQAQDISICSLVSVEFVITSISDQSTVHSPASDIGNGLWQYPINVAQMQNGIYYVVARGSDVDGGEAESDPVPFVVANECVENIDCDDELFCTGTETCAGGFCVEGENPCGELPCVEDNGTCTEPAAICELSIRTKKPIVPHYKKYKKAMLFVTVDGEFDPILAREFDLGPFLWKKGKLKIKKGVLKLKVKVPPNLEPNVYEIWVGGCRGYVSVLPTPPSKKKKKK